MSDTAELERLRADVEGLHEHIKGMAAELAAERRARQMAEADNVAVVAAATRVRAEYTTPAPFADPDLRWDARHALDTILALPHPGAAILAVVDAARAAVTEQSTDAYARLGWAVAEMEKQS